MPITPPANDLQTKEHLLFRKKWHTPLKNYIFEQHTERKFYLFLFSDFFWSVKPWIITQSILFYGNAKLIEILSVSWSQKYAWITDNRHKKKFTVCHLDFRFFKRGVGNFDLNFLSHFFPKSKCSCAHCKGNFLNFPKLTLLLSEVQM